MSNHLMRTVDKITININRVSHIFGIHHLIPFNITGNWNDIDRLRDGLYEMRHPNWVGYLLWVRSQQNGEFHVIKTNRLCENEVISPRWDLTSRQVKSQWGGVIFLHVNSFSRAVLPRQNYYLLSLAAACFYYFVEKRNWSYRIK